MQRRSWLTTLLLAVLPAAGADLPADLVGSTGLPTVAWRLDGVPPGATVAGFPTESGYLLLVGGARRAGRVAPLGDLCVVSPGGWAVRRLTSEHSLEGLPAILRQVVVAGDLSGVVRVWPLGRAARESAPPRIELGRALRVGPLVLGDDYVIAAENQILRITNLVEVSWRRDLDGPVTAPLASDGLRLYAAVGRTLVGLDAGNGAVAWSVDAEAPVATGLIVTAGLVLAGFEDGSIQAYDTATGHRQWRTEVAMAPFSRHLALAATWVVAAGANGRLAAVDAASGEPRWTAERPGPLSNPTVAFGHVFVVGGDGRLYAVPFDPAAEGWSFAETGPDGTATELVGDACVFGRRVYVTTRGGTLVALDLPAAVGPAPWPVPGGTAHRNGRVVPLEEP